MWCIWFSKENNLTTTNIIFKQNYKHNLSVCMRENKEKDWLLITDPPSIEAIYVAFTCIYLRIKCDAKSHSHNGKYSS